MNGLSPKDVKKANLQPVAGVIANTPISEDFGLSAGGSKYMRVDLEVSGVTVAGSITAKLQHRSPGGSFVDLVGANASVIITADGTFGLTQVVDRAADQPNMPLRKQMQVVLTTTNAGDEITIDKVWLTQEL